MPRHIMTTPEFVRRSKELHGDKYDYSESVYVGQRVKVRIFCKACQKHFEQLPQKHYAFGEGCWDCGVRKRADGRKLPFDRFVEKAHAKHGKRYEYVASTFTSGKEKLTMRCLACNHVFEQRGNAHLQGSGCPQCSVERAHVKQSYGYSGFIERAKRIHGDKFTYFECTDPNWTQRSVVTWQCNDCGIIREQLVVNHLAGKGCAQCSGTMKHTLETFVARAEKVHGKDRYDYSEVAFAKTRDRVWLTCNACTSRFAITVRSHLSGRGCPCCVHQEVA